MTISDQTSYIKIEILRGKNPTEIHGAFSKVCGVNIVDRSTVSRWANRFRGGCVSIDNDRKPGRPRTSTDERCVKLVVDTLEKDHRASCKEFSRATGAKTSQENSQEPTSVARGWATHTPRQCSPAHCECCNQKTSPLSVKSVTSCALQSIHEFTRLRLFPKLK